MCLWWSCGVLPPSPVYFHVASTFTSLFIYYVLNIVKPQWHLLLYIYIQWYPIRHLVVLVGILGACHDNLS